MAARECTLDPGVNFIVGTTDGRVTNKASETDAVLNASRDRRQDLAVTEVLEKRSRIWRIKVNQTKSKSEIRNQKSEPRDAKEKGLTGCHRC